MAAMRKWRSSAAYRIAFANFGIFSIGLALLGVVVFWAMHVAFTRQLDAMIGDETQTLIDEYRTGGDRELREAIAEREMSRSPTRMVYAVFAPDGRKLYGTLRTAAAEAGIARHPVHRPGRRTRSGAGARSRHRAGAAAGRRRRPRMDRADRQDRDRSVRGGIRRRLADRLCRRAHVRRLFEAAAALDQRHRRSDHRRRHSRTNAGQRPPRRVRPARFDAQPHARSNRRTARKPAPGLERRRPRPAHTSCRASATGSSWARRARPEEASTLLCSKMRSCGSTKCYRCSPRSCASPKSKAARPGDSSPRSILARWPLNWRKASPPSCSTAAEPCCGRSSLA